jgi:hypothetical protein
MVKWMLLFSLTACAGALTDPQDFSYLQDAGTLLDDGGSIGGGCDPVSTLFVPTCATASCHSAITQQAGLDLESPGLPGRLVGRKCTGGPGFLIDKDHPDQSVMYTKVTSTPPFNFQMPLGGSPLDDDQIGCIKEWVEAAAQ